MLALEGPMNARPASSIFRTSALFSAKNP